METSCGREMTLREYLESSALINKEHRIWQDFLALESENAALKDKGTVNKKPTYYVSYPWDEARLKAHRKGAK